MTRLRGSNVSGARAAGLAPNKSERQEGGSKPSIPDNAFAACSAAASWEGLGCLPSDEPTEKQLLGGPRLFIFSFFVK